VAEAQISCAIQGAMRQITVTGSTFESLTEDLIDRMMGRCERPLKNWV